MLTLKQIRENPEEVIKRLRIKNFDASDLIHQVLEADTERRRIQTETDARQADLNLKSKEIGALLQQQKVEEANHARQEVAALKEDLKQLNQELHRLENKLNELLVLIPNLPHSSVPPGKGAPDNVEVRHGGAIPELNDQALPHWDLGTKYGLIDFDLGNKLTGAGFPVFTGKGAKLVRALIGFFLDEAEKEGYREVLPPLMVNEASAYGTGQLPDKEGQMYQLATDPYYLIPTAEVPVTNIYRDVILDAGELPVKNTAYTPCFRREAGSYGKDVRGLNRVHQFDKVEIVQIQHPDKSYDTLEEMVSHVEQLVMKLGLPYRILQLCGGDLSFTSALTYDFEVYAAAQKKWLEVSSVSNFESYQANRLRLRYREPGSKKTLLAHTLNGSALALPRIIAALLENNQTPEGIKIPEALVPYTHYKTIP
ncbi:MAG: serine--tRNA ligase [Bacteroidales bacterium]|nr:serine--tRNA ligase [Bacteroidales bacterium]